MSSPFPAPVSALRRAPCAMAAVAVAMLAMLLAGCATPPPAPLVPLPDHLMPAREDLAYRSRRVVVAESAGRHSDVESAFVAQLKSQLSRYGIQQIASDADTARVLRQMLQAQAASGGEINVKDLEYETSHADGVIGVTVYSVTVPKRNAVTSWYDKKKKKTHYRYTTEVAISGHYTVVRPGSGTARTVQFSEKETKTSYEKPHQVSTQEMALKAARDAARSATVMRPLYTLFPLTGYIIGNDAHPRDIRINRGLAQGVRRDRKWELLMETREQNVLMGEMVGETVVGTAITREVYEEYCVARCNSSRTRERAKLGMKVRAQGFGFSFSSLFSAQ